MRVALSTARELVSLLAVFAFVAAMPGALIAIH